MGHVGTISRVSRAFGLAVAFGLSVVLGGCGGVEFQGKVFDYMGLSGDHTQADVHMAERPPLLLPPDTKKLPQPGGGVAVATARPDWPTNPEVVTKQIATDQKVQEAKKEAEADPDAPLNPYTGKPTLLDKAFGKLWSKGTEVQPVDDVPEPDPSDKRPEDEGKTAIASSGAPKAPQVKDAVLPAPEDDPFHPAAPDSYKGVSGGENAKNY